MRRGSCGQQDKDHDGSKGSPAAELAQEQLQRQVLQQHPLSQAALPGVQTWGPLLPAELVP